MYIEHLTGDGGGRGERQLPAATRWRVRLCWGAGGAAILRVAAAGKAYTCHQLRLQALRQRECSLDMTHGTVLTPNMSSFSSKCVKARPE